jgi:hypothetical protein
MNAEARHHNLLLRLFLRLRATRFSTIAFYCFGCLVIVIWFVRLVPDISEIKTEGVVHWILNVPIPLMLIGFTMLVIQQISVESGSEMVRRPVWFFLVVAFATACAYGVIWLYDQLTGIGIYAGFYQQHVFPEYYRYGIFFAPLSWLSCLYLQRSEDEARFVTLSIRRSMLSREIAHSQLLATRAKIDPELVVRILSDVHIQYQANPDEASKLMDHLISYLRLAMNRMGEKNPSLTNEAELIRAYFALREAEISVKIDLELCFTEKSALRQEKSSVPIFLIAQKVFDVAVYEGAKSLKIHIDALGDSMRIALGLGTAPVSEAGLANLRARLIELSGHMEDTLHHIVESGEHWHVIDIPIE